MARLHHSEAAHLAGPVLPNPCQRGSQYRRQVRNAGRQDAQASSAIDAFMVE